MNILFQNLPFSSSLIEKINHEFFDPLLQNFLLENNFIEIITVNENTYKIININLNIIDILFARKVLLQYFPKLNDLISLKQQSYIETTKTHISDLTLIINKADPSDNINLLSNRLKKEQTILNLLS